MASALVANPCNRRHKKRITSKKDLLFYIALMAIPCAQFIVFYIFVNFKCFLMAFQTYQDGGFVFNDITNPSDFWKSFYQIFHYSEINGYSLGIYFKNSVIAWVVSMLVGTVLAIVFSYYIYKNRKFCHFFKFFLFLPSVIPSILLTAIFTGFLDEYAVPFCKTVLNMTEIPAKLIDDNSPYSFAVVLTFGTWISFGTSVLLYTNAMNQINKSVIEASEIDGCGPTRQLIHVVLPGIMPTVGTFLTAGIAGFFTNQALLYNFFPGGTTKFGTVGYFMYLYANPSGATAYENYPFITAFGLCCSLIAIPLVFALKRFLKRWER